VIDNTLDCAAGPITIAAICAAEILVAHARAPAA